MVGAGWVQKLFHRNARVQTSASGRDWLREAGAIEKQGDWPGLIKHCQEWVQAEPAYFFAWQSLGDALQLDKQFDSAIQAYGQALELNAKVASTWCSLAGAYAAQNQIVEATKCLQTMESVMRNNKDDPLADSVTAWVGLALSYLSLNQPERTEQAFQQAESLTRNHTNEVDNWLTIGLAYRKLGLSDKVAEVYQQVCAIDPALECQGFEELIAKRFPRS